MSDSEGTSTELIDDEGRLFGRINVIDALVVLLIAAVVVAGAAFVLTDDPAPAPETDTTYATLDVGTQPAYIVEAVNEGDTYSPNDLSTMTVTDVQLTPRGNDIGVTLRVELEGELQNDGTISYGNAPLRLGRSLSLNTDRYQLNGQIRAVGEGDGLQREDTTVVVRDTLGTDDAESVAPGDEVRLAGRTVATVENVTRFPTGNPDRQRVFVTANLSTHREGDERRFGGSPVQRGQSVRLSTGDYTVNGVIERAGSGLEFDETTVVVRDTLATRDANEIAADDEIRLGDQTVATVEEVTQFATNDPNQRRVFLVATLRTYRQDGSQRFGTDTVRRGQGVTLSTPAYTVEGRIEQVGEDSRIGSASRRTVTLRMDDVRDDMADAINPGLTERAGGNTVARVTDVQVEPSLIIATGEDGSVNVVDHPIDRQVTLTTDLMVRETVSGPQFKGDPLRQGESVTLDLGTITVRATVVNVSG